LGIEMGGTTSNGRFTLLPMPCLGDCDHAPALMIDEDLHDDLDAEKVTRILGDYGDGIGKGHG
jgi:NADH-quinone oxidoreductase subunit E